MVWHAYMLNPRDFLEDCIRFGKMDFWATGLPWNVIDPCIDTTSFDYRASAEAMRVFESKTGLTWDNLHDGRNKAIGCPGCQKKVECAWTSSYLYSQIHNGGLWNGSGYADKGFCVQCTSCGTSITHDLLRVAKFRKDVQLFLKDHRPMPGTILSLEGLPLKASDKSRHEVSFPNRLIGAGSKTQLMDLSYASAGDVSGIDSVRNRIESAIQGRKLIRKANNTLLTVALTRTEKIAIRRMLAHYWDNSSVFALDLVGAVIRQGSFIQKMHAIDWIHSPALAGTMERAITKYKRYFSILANYPEHFAVPTLDVDLAWHTHQLSPPVYFEYSLKTTKIFIDHDDKVDENKLSDAFEWTSKTYEKIFNEVYSECTCWYCEAVRESNTSTISRLFTKNEPADLARLQATMGISDPNKGPHISSHSSVKATSLVADKMAAAKKRRLEAAYEKACQRAEKKGRAPPLRDDDDCEDAFGRPLEASGGLLDASGGLLDASGGPLDASGGPLVVRKSAPYEHDPDVTDGMYPAAPACMNLSAGAIGNCAAGTCGGGVASGSCATSAGACAGGSAGGCGGGGSGSAGGGGGGSSSGGGGCGGGGGGGGS